MPDVRMPDGTVIRNVPENATRQQIDQIYQRARERGAVEDKRPASFGRGFMNQINRAAANMIWLQDAITGQTIAKSITGAPLKSDIARTQADRASQRSPYRGSTAGNITGGVVATLPSMLLPGGPIVQGAASGAMLTRDPNNARELASDTVIGGAAGKIGQVVGSRIVAPVAERVGRTRPARAIAREAVAAYNRATGKSAQVLPLPRPTKIDRAITKTAPRLDEVRQTVADAQRLNLPISLADTNPQLRTLAGSVTRFSPEARTLAERNYGPRGRGQADRAVNAIDEHLAPITDIRARAAQIIEDGKPVYGPLYDKAYEAPPITSPRLEQVLQTPAGREAAGRANTIAANEFRNPRAMGFAVDEAGNPVLNPVPANAMDRFDLAREGWDAASQAHEAALLRQRASLNPSAFAKEVDDAGAALKSANAELDAARSAFQAAPKSSEVQPQNAYTTQSLDYVKRGIDDILEPQRNPITGKLNLDEGGRAIQGVRRALVDEVDNLNPAYRTARDAYGEFAQQAEALKTGHQVLPSSNLPQRDFDAILSRSTDATRPELQRGYATAMADEVGKRRLSANPYESIYGSTDQQAKVGTLFPEGAADFRRVYDLEKEMAGTATETLGGSQTQPRKVADENFANGVMEAISDASNSNLGSTMGIVKAGLRMAGDRKRLGLIGAQKKATEMAPRLLDTENPQAIIDYLDKLAKDRMEMEARRRAYANVGGLLAFPAAVGTTAATR